MPSDLIVAAGGVVWRPAPTGPEVLIAHRVRYDDWSLPKGKEEPGETPEEPALREVREETGVLARIVAPAGESRYPTAGGDKLVRWFAMRAV
ncbi:MAG: NUDIX hydrolase, partial [Actinomycetota bacterium]